MLKEFEFVAATFTPMHHDGSVDLEGIKPYISFLTHEGLKSIFINGTTGESLSLSSDERIQLADAWFDNAKDRLKILVHVGHNSIEEAIRLSRHAQQRGATAIGCMAPCFFRPQNVEELLDFLEPIAAAAFSTPFFFYHLPSLTGVHLNMEEFILKASTRIPSLGGIKYTHEDLNEFQRCEVKWGDKYQFYWGRDELLLPALGIGARGGVGSIYGLLPKAFAAIEKSYLEGDRTQALKTSDEVNWFIEQLKEVGVLAGGKAMLARLGIGSGMVRLPLKTIADITANQVLQAARNVPYGETWKFVGTAL